MILYALLIQFLIDCGYSLQSAQVMTARNPFAVQSREQVTKSIVNWSHSKQLWTFPKKKRFQTIKAECPRAFYNQNLNQLSNIEVRFPTSTRKLFTENAQTPSPAQYFQTQQPNTKGLSFGLAREKCRFSSYIKPELANNPGPNKYDKFAGDEEEKSKRGYSLRPKTANNRNYFIDNKELIQVPSPCNYQIEFDKSGGSKIAKFRSVALGGVGLMKKSKRFEGSLTKTPGPSAYRPKKATRSSSIGGKIGNSLRCSFIDEISHSHKSPGPGDYLLPSEFGHYKKVGLHSRMVTIE